MHVSVIIPTYNRVKDLDECLDSVIIQTISPYEVIMVDDSENNEIKKLVERRNDEFTGKKILLRYFKNKREKSLTIARNYGIRKAAGDIILFLDSDVVLDKNYILEILKVYKEKPEAIGVQGLIQTTRKDRTLIRRSMDMLYKIFYIKLDEKNKFQVLPSMGISFPSVVDEVINCEWLSGANQAYKKEIFKEFKFDENLKRYCWGEDQDTSYRIFKKYTKSLFMTPYAKLTHKASQEGRHLKRDVVYMDVIYYTYLFYKNIDQTRKNKLIYLWSRTGRIFIKLIFFVFKPSKSKLAEIKEIKYMLESVFYCAKHMKEIKAGNLDFFNDRLK